MKLGVVNKLDTWNLIVLALVRCVNTTPTLLTFYVNFSVYIKLVG
jgi:hypothetical protein